jgi:WD40 repeat protein
MALDITSDDKKFVSVSYDRRIKIWDFKTRKLLKKIDEAHSGKNSTSASMVEYITCCKLAPNDKFLMTGAFDKSVKIWNMEDLFCECNFIEAHNDTVTCVTITNDCKYGASSSEDAMIKIWNIYDKECLHTFPEAHFGKITRAQAYL